MGFVPIEILTNLKLNLLNEKKITIVWYCRQSKDYGLKDYHGIKTTFELTPQKSSSEKNYGNFTNHPNSGTPPFFFLVTNNVFPADLILLRPLCAPGGSPQDNN